MKMGRTAAGRWTNERMWNNCAAQLEQLLINNGTVPRNRNLRYAQTITVSVATMTTATFGRIRSIQFQKRKRSCIQDGHSELWSNGGSNKCVKKCTRKLKNWVDGRECPNSAVMWACPDHQCPIHWSHHIRNSTDFRNSSAKLNRNAEEKYNFDTQQYSHSIEVCMICFIVFLSFDEDASQRLMSTFIIFIVDNVPFLIQWRDRMRKKIACN